MDFAIDQAEHVLEGMVAFPEINKRPGRKTPGAKLVGGEASNRRQAAGVLVGIRMEQDSVDSAENSSAGANSQSKREYGNRSEDWRFADLAESEATISKERMEPIGDT